MKFKSILSRPSKMPSVPHLFHPFGTQGWFWDQSKVSQKLEIEVVCVTRIDQRLSSQ